MTFASRRTSNDTTATPTTATTTTPDVTPTPPPRRHPFDRHRRPMIRTLDRIIASDAYDVDGFRPMAKKDSRKEKEKLQNLMASNGASAVAAEDDDDGHGGAL
ncbi:hypothetical protein BDK51DRAFT_39729 [Blyttiomyces helicus]|uniref:Uncharacterized protein n=1 Tax=Blyttiomyces helicus TaxID=388810 RepID=A0A4V1IPJ4_9FUNG|nr:hypothetical protein BDK51DRAFT_39729 [Blyttiomyces helicus]|eukprot:RKO83267.1 hypothetical protein BDK51DRAFT_39729 [Blyttiomyces helicus]